MSALNCELIKAKRNAKLLSLKEASSRLKITSKRLVKLENGNGKEPKLSEIVALKNFYGIPYQKLILDD